MESFSGLVQRHSPRSSRSERLDTLMLNLGLACNMACRHCHVSAGPHRTETMSYAVLERSLELATRTPPLLVDVTGGSPELHPRIRHLVATLRTAGVPVRLRTNLTALRQPQALGLDLFLARHDVQLLASLPSADAETVDGERGAGAFDLSLAVLRQLNTLGYGTGARRLDLAANAAPSSESPDPAAIEEATREELGRLGVVFDDLLIITNVPVGRFAENLRRMGALESYVEELRREFNPETLPRLGCRFGVEISWDGRFSDCDFNTGADLRCVEGSPADVFDQRLDTTGLALLANRPINFGEHCIACAAARGSS